jgi:hypothetical protein
VEERRRFERFQLRLPVRMEVTITLSSDRIKELTGSQSLIKVQGMVVRSAPTGLAVSFAGREEILSLNAQGAPPHREDDLDESLHDRSA